jgi:hypothetical protein
MKPETKIVAKIMAELKKIGGVATKLHGGPMQVAGLPDILWVFGGRAIFFEVKQPGQVPTKLQFAKMQEMEQRGGAICFLVFSAADVIRILQEAGLYVHPQTKTIRASGDRSPGRVDSPAATGATAAGATAAFLAAGVQNLAG